MNSRLNFKQISLLKPSCLICGGGNASDFNHTLHICGGCHADLPWRTGFYCLQCGLPHTHQADNVVCGQCLQLTPHFDTTNAIFDYDFPIDAVLQNYKYQHRLTLAHFFSDCLIDHLHPDQGQKIDRIIPMPMHPARLQHRGFNQALEIARLVSTKLNIPLDYQSCTRIKNNQPQASLPLKARVKNVRNVFACEQDFTGQAIVLIDDVMTSGASLNALSKTIKAAGAKYVSCWVIARTLSHAR